mgnify:CR=1 FL=1
MAVVSKASTGVRERLKPEVLDLLDHTYAGLQTTSMADRYWAQSTPGQRKKLGRNLETAYRTIGGAVKMHMRLTDLPLALAILELGERWNFISSANKRECLVDLSKHDPTVRAALRRTTHVLDDDLQTKVAVARNTRRLVLVTGTIKRLYVDGQLVDVAWSDCPASWDFLVMLAQTTLARRVVDHSTLESDNPELPKTRCANLRRALNKAQIDSTVRDAVKQMIRRDAVREGYCIDLPSKDIEIIHTSADALEAELY